MVMNPDFEAGRARAYAAALEGERHGYEVKLAGLVDKEGEAAQLLAERIKACDAEIARVRKAKRVTPHIETPEVKPTGDPLADFKQEMAGMKAELAALRAERDEAVKAAEAAELAERQAREAAEAASKQRGK